MRSRARTIALRLAAAVVIALHAALLIQRIADHSITNPGVIARWLVAAILGGALRLLHGRRSWRAWLVFSIAIVLMHAGTPQAILVIAPLIAVVLALVVSRPRGVTRFADLGELEFPAVVPCDCTAGRAPPLL